MAGTASDPFFWNDWQADILLRTCSFGAQGFWMRLLCIAAESSEKGYVLVNRRRPSDALLSQITGASESEVKMYLQELCDNGVASRNAGGVLYNRRMVRLERKRRASAKGGKAGGRVTHDKRVGIFESSGGARGERTPELTESDGGGAEVGDAVTNSKQKGIFTTQDPTQHPRRAPLPFPSPLEEESKKERKSISLESPSEGAGNSRSIQTRKSLNGHKEDFDAFYAAFPKHVGKVAAEKAYRAALKKAAAEDILTGAMRYAMARKGEDQEFTAHPATWLKAGRWMDENQGGAALDPHVAKFRQLEQANPTPPLKRNPVTGKWSDT